MIAQLPLIEYHEKKGHAPKEKHNRNEQPMRFQKEKTRGDLTQPNQLKGEVIDLPSWIWSQNSCSLDSMLLVALRVHQEIPEIMDTADPANNTEPIFEYFRSHVKEWIQQGPWTSYSDVEMKKLRNNIRDMLKTIHKIHVDNNSSIAAIQDKILPPELTTLTVQHTWKCSHCTLEMKKKWNSQCLYPEGTWLDRSNTQDVLTKLVNSLNLCINMI